MWRASRCHGREGEQRCGHDPSSQPRPARESLTDFQPQAQAGKLRGVAAKAAAIATLRGLRYGSHDDYCGFEIRHVDDLLPTRPEFGRHFEADGASPGNPRRFARPPY